MGEKDSSPSSIKGKKFLRRRWISIFLFVLALLGFFLSFTLLIYFLLQGGGTWWPITKALADDPPNDQEEGTQVTITISPRKSPDEITTPTRIINPNPIPPHGNPIIIEVDNWGMALSSTTGQVDAKVNMPAECWLHWGENKDNLDRLTGPEKADAVLRVRYNLEGLTPKTTYWFQTEAHSTEHEGVVGYAPIRSFTTPGQGGGAGIVPGAPEPFEEKVWENIKKYWWWLIPGVGFLILLFLLIRKNLIGYILTPIDGRVEFSETIKKLSDPDEKYEKLILHKWIPPLNMFFVYGEEGPLHGKTVVVFSKEPLKILKNYCKEEEEKKEYGQKILKVRRKWRKLFEKIFLIKKKKEQKYFYGWKWLNKEEQLSLFLPPD